LQKILSESDRPTASLEPSTPTNNASKVQDDRIAIVGGAVTIPPRFQLPGVRRAKLAESLDAWLAEFPADAALLKEFSAAHFGVYKVNSSAQVAWMATQGYPMPEDVIAASTMSNADLRQLADAGNAKAALMLYERNVSDVKSKMEAYIAQGGSPTDFWKSDPDGVRLLAARHADEALLRQVASPYKGYVQAQASILDRDPVNAVSKVAVGLLLAANMGDSRAIQLLDAYAGSDAVRSAIISSAELVNAATLQQVKQLYGNSCWRIDSPIPNGFQQIQ
jgi:hypothetical protein